jgi:hypothetical protein
MPDNPNRLVGDFETVADGTISQQTLRNRLVMLVVRHWGPTVYYPSGNENGTGDYFDVGGADDKSTAIFFECGYSIMLHLYAVFGGLGAHPPEQLFSSDPVREARMIVGYGDSCGPARAVIKEGHGKVVAREVDGSRQTSRPATDHHTIFEP